MAIRKQRTRQTRAKGRFSIDPRLFDLSHEEIRADLDYPAGTRRRRRAGSGR